MNITIRSENDSDRQAIWDVNAAAFGGSAESDLIDALRAGGYSEVSLVAEVDNEIVGHILFSTVTIRTSTEVVAALSLAPMAVAPAFQRQGIGSQLVRAGLDACRQTNYRIIVVLGHPSFYPRFGFSPELAKRLTQPFGGGDAWMALELVPGAMTKLVGTVEYSPPFGVLDR